MPSIAIANAFRSVIMAWVTNTLKDDTNVIMGLNFVFPDLNAWTEDERTLLTNWNNSQFWEKKLEVVAQLGINDYQSHTLNCVVAADRVYLADEDGRRSLSAMVVYFDREGNECKDVLPVHSPDAGQRKWLRALSPTIIEDAVFRVIPWLR